MINPTLELNRYPTLAGKSLPPVLKEIAVATYELAGEYLWL